MLIFKYSSTSCYILFMFIRFYSIINEYSIIKNKKRNGNEFYKYVLYILIYAFNILIIHCLINITGTVIKSVIKCVYYTVVVWSFMEVYTKLKISHHCHIRHILYYDIMFYSVTIRIRSFYFLSFFYVEINK